MPKQHDLPGWKILKWIEKLGWCHRAYNQDREKLNQRLEKFRKEDPKGQYIIRRCRKIKQAKAYGTSN